MPIYVNGISNVSIHTINNQFKTENYILNGDLNLTVSDDGKDYFDESSSTLNNYIKIVSNNIEKEDNLDNKEVILNLKENELNEKEAKLILKENELNEKEFALFSRDNELDEKETYLSLKENELKKIETNLLLKEDKLSKEIGEKSEILNIKEALLQKEKEELELQKTNYKILEEELNRYEENLTLKNKNLIAQEEKLKMIENELKEYEINLNIKENELKKQEELNNNQIIESSNFDEKEYLNQKDNLVSNQSHDFKIKNDEDLVIEGKEDNSNDVSYTYNHNKNSIYTLNSRKLLISFILSLISFLIIIILLIFRKRRILYG